MTETTKTSRKPTQDAPKAASMFGADEEYEVVNVGLPPVSTAHVSAAASAVDLAKMARVWMLIGRGGSGKTLLARWLGGQIAQARSLDQTVLAALDPTNRTLTQFFENVEQPGSQNTGEASDFLRKLVKFTQSKRLDGIWDFGGGDVSLADLIRLSPQFDRALEQDGVAPIAAYLLTPAVDDIAILHSFEERGFQPKATALILNMGRADRFSAFGGLRAQPAYKAALARGAVEIIMPRLEPEDLALSVERRRKHFFEAAQGITMDAMMMRVWLKAMDDAFAPVASWLPWN